MKAPLSWPRGARDVNARDANAFAAERHFNLFWCEDLCAAPRTDIDELELGSWTRHSRFARQAVALDYESACKLAEVVSGGYLTLEYLLDWFCEDRRGATKAMEIGLPAATYAHVRLLCDLLTVDPALIKKLRVEYQAREDARQTLRFGRRVEDEERHERSTVDMSKPTGTGQLRRRARGAPRSSENGNHADDEAIIMAGAQALHERWRREDEVQGRPFFRSVPEAEFTAWFDPRFHDTFTRQQQMQVNMNVPLGYLPPSLQAESCAVAATVLAALQKPPPGPGGVCVAVTREAAAARVHEEWLARRASELKVVTDKQEAQLRAIKLFLTGDQLNELSAQGTSPFQVANSSSEQEPWPVQPKWYPLKGPMDSDVAFATLPQHFADSDLECVDLCISAFERMAKRQPQLLMPPAANVTKSDHLLRNTPANTPAANAIVPRFPSITTAESIDSTAITSGFLPSSQAGSALGLGSALGAPPPPPQPLAVLQDLKGRDCTIATRQTPEEIVTGLGRLRGALVMQPSARLELEPEPHHHHHHHHHGHHNGHNHHHHHHNGGEHHSEQSDATTPLSSVIVPMEAAHNPHAPLPAPVVRPIVTLNLCCVDLSGVASKPPPGAANFLDHLAQVQTSLFDEMKPRAKALLQSADSSLLQHLPEPDPSSAHRVKVDARSTLPGSVSMNTDLLLRGSTELSPAAAASAQRKLLLQANAVNDFDGSLSAAASQRGSPTSGSPSEFASPSRNKGSQIFPPSSNRKGSPTSSQASQGASPKPTGNLYGPEKAPNLAAAQALLLQTQIHLTTLLMRQCSLNTGCLYKLRREGLSSCSALTVLDVSDNALLKSEGCKQIALSLSALPQLKCLGMRRTCCSGDGAVLLLKALRYHRVLTLDLSHNSLGVPEEEGAGKGPIMKGLRTLVKTNLHLTHLDLSFNNFRADASRKLGDWLKQNMSLFGLHFAGNGHTVVDSRGFLRERASLPLDAGLGPARVVEYPSNPILPAHRDKCWICGRWASMPITFKLDLAALPPPPPPKKKGRKGKGGKGARNAAARGSMAAATAPSSGASLASASSSIASNPDQGDGTPGGLLYKTLVVTLHLSCDDPPYAATPMEESHEEPHEDDEDHNNDGDASGQMRTSAVTSSAPNSARSDPSTARSHSPPPPETSKTYKLTRMVPPGQLQYYFLVFGDGVLLTRYAGPKLEPDSPHSCHFGFPPRKPHAPPSKEASQLPNYAMLVRPDAFARDPLPNPTAVQLPPPVAAVDCGFVKIAPCEKILKILREKREPGFKTHNLEDPADESLASLDEDDDDNDADSEEEEVEWHPRNSQVFMPRAVESFGSFFDNEFDTGPKEREKSAAEIANENASVGALSSAASFGAANNSSNMAPGGGGEDGLGSSKLNNRSPVELAFDSDAKSLDRLMKSGLKYARAFYPAEITDRFTPEGMAPKPNHKSHDAQKRELMLTLLQAAAEEEMRVKRMRAAAAGEVFREESEANASKKQAGGGIDDDDDEEDEKLDPVEALFGLIAKNFGAIDAIHKQYAFVNSRSPFCMSVQSWLLFAKDTNLDSLVTFDSPKHTHNNGNGAIHTGRSNTEAEGSGSILPPITGAKTKVGSAIDVKKDNDRRGSTNSVASVHRPRDDLDMGLGREAKMALEVVFFTATGSEDDENNENDGAAAAAGGGGGDAAGKKTSAITLTFSKHDMRRKQFVLGLLALTRYRQRHMKRPRKRSSHLGTGRSSGVAGDRPGDEGHSSSSNFNINDGTSTSAEDQQALVAQHRPSDEERANMVPGSADEFLYILEHEVLPVALGPRAKRFSGDLFRTQMLYQTAVESVLLAHASTLEDIYKQYKLTVMGCGSAVKQLALAGWLKMLKDAEVLGEASACLTLGEATQSFLEARLAASAEAVVGDRGLSLVDFKEALVRTATRIHGHWPFPIKEIKVLSYEEAQAAEAAATAAEASVDFVAGGGVEPVLEHDSGDESSGSSGSDGEGGGEDDASSDSSGSDDGSLSTAAMLEKQRKKADEARAAEEALKKGLFGDPAFASTHATVCSLTELLIHALRDRDAAGLKHFHEQRPRMLEKVAHSFEPPPESKRASNAWNSLRSSIRAPPVRGSATAAPPAAPPQLSPEKLEAKREATLEAVAELAVQSLIVHKAKAKRRTPAVSRDAGDGDDLSAS